MDETQPAPQPAPPPVIPWWGWPLLGFMLWKVVAGGGEEKYGVKKVETQRLSGLRRRRRRRR